ncbi:MAG TPA: hypothetical protein VFY05_02305 [Candidatus Angelobacter sp.]|nr:hypothetical protein [Candidatus Angelobacter sp.]
MFCSRNRRSLRSSAGEHATSEDFQRIFSEDMAGLHLLAYLLTADHQLAEAVFVAGLEDTIDGNPVFREWARPWSQRAIVKRAIKIMAPSPKESHRSSVHMDPQTGNEELDALARSTTNLSTFQRFVFVLSVLEGYSIMECAALLSCAPADVIAAKVDALKLVAVHDNNQPEMPEPLINSWKSLFTPVRVS